jgi:hypothetical protein
LIIKIFAAGVTMITHTTALLDSEFSIAVWHRDYGCKSIGSVNQPAWSLMIGIGVVVVVSGEWIIDFYFPILLAPKLGLSWCCSDCLKIFRDCIIDSFCWRIPIRIILSRNTCPIIH